MFHPIPPIHSRVLQYPLTGHSQFSITREDMQRLNPDKMLNCDLIGTGLGSVRLRGVTNTELKFASSLLVDDFRGQTPELAKQCHVFDIYFTQNLRQLR
jgi:hypothetical protein